MTDALPCLDEATVVRFGEERLSPQDRTAAEAHAQRCPSCQGRLAASISAARAYVSSTMPLEVRLSLKPREASATPAPTAPEGLPAAPPLERGASIGRYTILSLVGKGGMGEVYAAYDPELDRKVALKLLLGTREGSDGRSQARLLREAKAIAKLSHGNVVVVHDAGTFDDRVFVAMEFVDGRTAKEWLAEAPRSRREILDVFIGAARGLAAAHAAGLVHRDFKPHNVMVGRDGGVRVMDFGLAREIGSSTEDAAPDGEVALPGGVAAPELTGALTRTGEIVGTPLYMAPEQFQGTATDARTDQFSFCVALYQALYGAHPFGGDTVQVILTRVVAGELQPVPAKHDVPAWLRRVLVRGLSVEPANRWPSMSALIAALESDPARARRRWAATAGVGLLVAAAVATLVRGPRRSEALCKGGPARLAGVWEPSPAASRPRADAVKAAFGATGLAQAAEQWQHVGPLLDRYAGAWLGMYRDACEATQVRGEQSAATLDLRMACLDQRRMALSALTDILRVADKTVVTTAVDAVNALPSLDTCADIKLLRADVEPPRDAATRARVEELRQRLAVAKALSDTGQHQRALAEGRTLERDARALGYRPFLAEVLSSTGQFQSGFGGGAEATVERLTEAALMALAVKRDDVAAEAGARLIGVAGYYLHRHDEGRRWASFTRAVIDRMGAGHERLRAWVVQAEAQMKLQDGDAAAALAMARQATELKRKALPPDHPDIAISRESEAEALVKLGKPDEALRIGDEVLAMFTRAYGPGGPQVVKTLSNRGEYLLAVGRPADALAAFRDSLARWEAQAGPDEVFLGYPLTGMGRALLELGKPGEAAPPLERALRLRASEQDPAMVAETRFTLARALWPDGDAAARRRARTLAGEARDGYMRVPDAKAAATVESWLSSTSR